MPDLAELLADLTAEADGLDRLVAGLDGPGWARDTPAAGWTVAHQIAHLAWTDARVREAATDAAGFTAAVARTLARGGPAALAALVDAGVRDTLVPPARLLAHWRHGRAELVRVLAGLPDGTRLPWFGTRMSPASAATARIMETWAHGEDVAAALGVVRAPTERLRHVAYLGVRTLGHSFATRGLPVPDAPVRVELAAPGGGTWAYGPPGAPDRVTGPALDFCLVVTRRRRSRDTALVPAGEVAARWLAIAQAFAGPPGPEPPPLPAGPTGPAGAVPADPGGPAGAGRP